MNRNTVTQHDTFEYFFADKFYTDYYPNDSRETFCPMCEGNHEGSYCQMGDE